jgi:transposase-like protein
VDSFPAERTALSVRGHRPRHSARVFIRIFEARTAANARRFLRDLERACPIRIRTILTDNGKEFTDRLFGLR